MYIKNLGEAVGGGIKSIPKSLWFGLVRVGKVMHPTDWQEPWNESKRFVRLLKNSVKTGITHTNPIVQTINIIVTIYLDYLPDCARHAVMRHAGLVGAGIGGKYIGTQIAARTIAKPIAQKIVADTFYKKLASIVVGNAASILVTIGIMEEAARASNRLKISYPNVYYELHKYDLDMVYFLIEQPMEKYLYSIKRAQLYPKMFKQEAIKNLCSN